MFVFSRTNIWVMLGVVIVFVCCSLACSESNNKEDGDGLYNFTGGDKDQQQNNDGDLDSQVEIPDCLDVCRQYCTLIKDCNSAGADSAQEYYCCLDDCREIPVKQKWESVISCGLDSTCVSFDDCRNAGGDPEFICDPGEKVEPGVDGDSESKEIDIEGDHCRFESECPQGWHCDLEFNICLVECNPYDDKCPQGQVCKVLTEGEAAGRGYAVCAPEWEGKEESEICEGQGDCAPGLLCGETAHCEVICNPELEDEQCSFGLSCETSDTYGFGTCAYCRHDKDCETGMACNEAGLCVPDIDCHVSADCDPGQACIHNYCKDGCKGDFDCSPSLCDNDSGYCYGDYCEEDCSALGLCCNRHECGPCCTPECPSNKTCQYDASCYPDLFCCVDQVDCREMPEGFCGSEPCDYLTGTCGGVCLESCDWGYSCGKWSGYVCKPTPPMGCSMAGMDCEDEPCMMCNGETLGEGGQCVATDDCGIEVLPEGFSCYPDPLFSLECGFGMTCCLGTDGFYSCCLAQNCYAGQGCIDPDMDGDQEDTVYNCPECATMEGVWQKQTGDCPAPWDTLVLERDENYSCLLVLYKDSAEWSNRLADLRHCEKQAILFFDNIGAYDQCVLFWDKAVQKYSFNCGGDTACKVDFIKQ